MIVKCKGNSKDKKKKSGEEKATFYNWYTSLSPIYFYNPALLAHIGG